MAPVLVRIGEKLIDASKVKLHARKWRNAWVWKDPVISLDHNAMKIIANSIVDQNYNAAHSSLISGYADSETDTWSKQELEARSYKADRAASTPFLDQYVKNNPSLTGANDTAKKSALIAKIIDHADSFALSLSSILGKSKELRISIEASKDPDALAKIDLSIN